ncbi:RNA-protein complex protein Nop10 [archaeon]|nr:MAG: RNA-protein complex protein Nop10 [archaeon]
MKIRKCEKCRIYTLKEVCRKCGSAAASPHPLRFSPEDKWGEWRRKAKQKKQGEEEKQAA